MRGDNFTYEIECDICEVVTEVTVYEIDEKPVFCAMCGEQVEPELIDEE